jgi:cyanophycin synthetase
VNALVDPRLTDPSDVDVEAITDRLRALADRDGLGPSTQSIVDEAERRDIPVIRLDEINAVQLGWGVNGRRIRATLTDGSSSIATDIAQQKDDSARLLDRAGLPVPAWNAVRTPEAAVEAAHEIGGPIVVKPIDGNQGRAVTIGELTDEDVVAAFETAMAASKRGGVIIQRAVPGNDHRLLVVGGKLIACAERVPAHVVGDGRRTVRQLVDHVNRDPRRGNGHTRELTRLKLDERALPIVAEQGYGPDDVPPERETVVLARTANLSTGGSSVDRTNQVHPEVVHVAQMAAQLVGLDVCGVDIVTTDISRPLRETGGGIVEVNAAPGFRMHTRPTVGRPRNVAGAVLDVLFPERSEGRIPIIAVTGTNGKTTTTRLIAHICGHAGRRVGMTSTEGIVVDGWTMKPGDMAGPRSAQVVLSLPSVDTAVLEVARGGIIREGLGYDYNDVAVVTNVAGDHLGLGGVDTIEDLAEVKRVIVEAVPRSGTAVLNADDRLVSQMARECRGSVAFTSTQLDADGRGRLRVLRHIANGGMGGLVEGLEPEAEDRSGGRLVVRRGDETLLGVALADIPITWNGSAMVNVANALQAACAALATGISADDVERGLRTFEASFATSAGRLNRLAVDGREVILDYAHNPAALGELCELVERVRGDRRVVGVVSVPGDRREEDKVTCGQIAGRMFDEVVVCEPNMRGRPPRETAEIVAGAAGVPWTYVESEVDAAREAMRRSNEADLVVLCIDKATPVYEALTGG